MLQDLAIGAVVALVASGIACRAFMRTGPMDLPDVARKAHRAPTPTSGGVGVAIGFGVGLIALALLPTTWGEMISEHGAVLASVGAAFAYGFLALGFIDDAFPLGPRLKFAIFTALAFGAALSVGVVTALPLSESLPLKLPFWLGLMGTVLWLFTLVNSVNFMDGANGLAMGSMAVGLAALGLIALQLGVLTGAGMAFCGAGALAGFLIWNAPSGRVFAGDAGALFAGAIGGIVALIIMSRASLSPFVGPIVFFPLLADALLTLGWRAKRGRSLLEGHTEHIYQIAIRAGWSHLRVALAYWAAMAACGAIGYLTAMSREPSAPPLALAGLALVAIVISFTVRRGAAKRGILEI